MGDEMTPDVPEVIYHFVPAAVFDGADPDELYYPDGFAEEGFIHTTVEPEWVEKIADRVLADHRGEVYLFEIDTELVLAEIRMEQAKGHWFPHIYGGLNRDAIRRTAALVRDTDGYFRFPNELR